MTTGCAAKVTTQPATTQVSQANTEIAAARELLGKSEQAIIEVGHANGPSGAAAVKAAADAQQLLDDATTHVAAAKAALTTSPDLEAQSKLADLEKALGLYRSAIPLGRALAIEDEPCQQAIDGWNKIADAIPLGNSEEYSKALKLGKAARVLLLKAETALAQPAKTYSDSPSIKALYDWCVQARKLADIEIKMDTAGKKGRTTTYNKLVTSFNAQKGLVNGKPDPGAEWNKLNDAWRAAFDKAYEAFSALK